MCLCEASKRRNSNSELRKRYRHILVKSTLRPDGSKRHPENRRVAVVLWRSTLGKKRLQSFASTARWHQLTCPNRAMDHWRRFQFRTPHTVHQIGLTRGSVHVVGNPLVGKAMEAESWKFPSNSMV
eukprot:3962842-Amphidinium_carterae.2